MNDARILVTVYGFLNGPRHQMAESETEEGMECITGVMRPSKTNVLQETIEMTAYRTNRSGFTLIEILIVVIILGILAAIVIPQFTNASTDARKSSVSSQLQTLRSQIELYKLQHNDALPNLITNWDQLTKKTNVAGSTTIGTGEIAFGPYLQQIPSNPLNQKNTVLTGDGTAAPSAACGFIYDYGTSGSGTGHVWAGGTTGATYYNESTGVDSSTVVTTSTSSN